MCGGKTFFPEGGQLAGELLRNGHSRRAANSGRALVQFDMPAVPRRRRAVTAAITGGSGAKGSVARGATEGRAKRNGRAADSEPPATGTGGLPFLIAV